MMEHYTEKTVCHDMYDKNINLKNNCFLLNNVKFIPDTTVLLHYYYYYYYSLVFTHKPV